MHVTNKGDPLPGKFQLNMVDETSSEQYELGPAWVRVTSNEDYWREMPVTNKGDPLPGKF